MWIYLQCLIDICVGYPRKIAIVGNGLTSQPFGDEIDAHDLVVRINLATYAGIAGERTDVLAIVNWSNPGYLMSHGETQVNPIALKATKALWLPMPQKEMAAARTALIEPPPWPAYADFTEDVITNLVGDRPFVKFPAAIWRDLTRSLQSHGAAKGDIASTGALVLAYAVRRYPLSQITLFGFTHEGWDGHPWLAEELWIKTLQNVRYRR